MAEKISVLPGSCPDLETLIAIVRERCPEGKKGIVAFFDEEGGVHIHWHCSPQELAFAATRLIHHSNEMSDAQ